MDRIQYVASLLHLQSAGRSFCAAFRAAAAAAQTLDPRGEQRDPAAETIMLDLAAQLRGVCEHVPGARELFLVAVVPVPDRKE